MRNNYFDDAVEYPRDFLGDEVLPFGVLYDYVSSQFLDGFINYCKPVKCFAVVRYDDDELSLEEVQKMPHTKFTAFGTDVMILASCGESKYIVFYYDQDVSDCSIGRFEADLDVDGVSPLDFFPGMEYREIIEVPVGVLRGWLHWS